MQSENLTIPRGKAYFGKFSPNTQGVESWFSLGNVPELTFISESKSIADFDSIHGRIVQVSNFVTEQALSASITTDDLGIENYKLWSKVIGLVKTDPSGYVTETHQLNKGSIILLNGNAYASLSIIDNLGNTWISGVDYVYDDVSNAISILNHSLIYSVSSVNVRYFSIGQSRTEYVLKPSTIDLVEGELRIISTNPIGPKYHFRIHRVSISPSQSHLLIGDPNNINWSTLSFDVSILKKSGTDELYSMRVYSETAIEFNGALVVDTNGNVLTV